MKRCSLEVHEYCLSTMDLARRWCEEKTQDNGAHFIQCLSQSGGRGKRGRVWFSGAGNFLGTLIFPFPFEPQKRGDMSFLAAVCIADTLKTINPALDLQLKWPNDIMIERKKMGGILLEFLEGKNNRPYLSMGIGLNLHSHPKDIPSTCLKYYTENLPDLDHFRDILIEKLFDYYDLWVKDGFKTIRDLWLTYAMDLNESIQISVGKEVVYGVFKTINSKGGLVLVCEKGVEKIFYTGEVFFDSP